MQYNVLRVESNLEALTALKSGEASYEALSKYTGWGGLRGAIYQPDIYQKMRSCLSSKEIDSIKGTVKTAYYTPDVLVKFIYAMLDTFNIKPTSILEPSAGHGVFFKNMPDKYRKSTIYAFEPDLVTFGILKSCYADIHAKCMRFEEYQESKKFDLIVGNPPYGQI